MEIIIVSAPEPVDEPLDPPLRAAVEASPEFDPAAAEQNRFARQADSAETIARISSLEDALAAATWSAGEQRKSLRRRRRLWLGTVAVLMVAGALWQAVLYYPDQRGPASAASIEADSRQAGYHKPQPAPATESALQRFARLPSPTQSDPRPLPAPTGELARAAEQLGAAFEMHPEQAWPQILNHIRETSGHAVCPFLWVDGKFAFILPEAPLGIRSLPAAMARCAAAVDASH